MTCGFWQEPKSDSSQPWGSVLWLSVEASSTVMITNVVLLAPVLEVGST